MSCHSLFLGYQILSPLSYPAVSPRVLLRQSAHLDYTAMLSHLPEMRPPPHCLQAPASHPTCQTGSLFWIHRSPELSFDTPADDEVWALSHPGQRQLASRRSSHSPHPVVCSPPLASHRGPEVRSQKILHKIWLGIILSLCVTFSGIYPDLLWHTVPHSHCFKHPPLLWWRWSVLLGIVNPHLVCTSLVSMDN